jgi:uncharacterized protein
MALTNYLSQSVIFSSVFYGWGLGQFGQIGVMPALAGGTLFYILQLLGSRWWLQRFHFGPVEWLWRSLTYGHWQPFRLPIEAIISKAADAGRSAG